MKYDGDGRATARFFPVKDVAVLLFLLRRLTRRGGTLPVVSVPRPAGTGRALLRSRLAPVTVYASLSPFSDERLQAAFAAYSRRQKDDGCDIPGRPDPLPDAVNSPQAAGNGPTGGPSRCPL